jgi:hypothetical protein
MTTQASLDVWSSRLHELKISEQAAEIAALRALIMAAAGLIDRSYDEHSEGRYDEWWDTADEALKRTVSYGLPT